MLRTRTSPGSKSKEDGSVLLEGLIAILIFSFGILGLIGLQAASMKNTTQAKERISASLLANKRIAEMWVDRANLSTYVETATDISPTASNAADRTTLPNGTRTTVVAADQVTVTLSWKMPGETTANQFVTVARINGN